MQWGCQDFIGGRAKHPKDLCMGNIARVLPAPLSRWEQYDVQPFSRGLVFHLDNFFLGKIFITFRFS